MALFILCSWALERKYHQRSDAAQSWYAARSSHEINESVALETFSRTKKIVLVVHRLPSPERLATIAMYRPFFHTVVYLQPQNSPDTPGELLRAQERATLTGRLHANEVVRTPSATMGRVLLSSILRRSKTTFLMSSWLCVLDLRMPSTPQDGLLCRPCICLHSRSDGGRWKLGAQHFYGANLHACR